MEERERKVSEELLVEREARKSSIPDEPTEGDIIRLTFRCPDGSSLLRNFAADEKLDLLFQWIEVNEEI